MTCNSPNGCFCQPNPIRRIYSLWWLRGYTVVELSPGVYAYQYLPEGA